MFRELMLWLEGTPLAMMVSHGQFGFPALEMIHVTATTFVFGMITIAGARIWIDNKVDFLDSRNMLVGGITLVLGTGDFTLKFGDFVIGGIGTAAFGAILLHALLAKGKP